jgi:hypothetical protein
MLIQTLHPYIPNTDNVDQSISIEIHMERLRTIRPFVVRTLTGRIKQEDYFDCISDAVMFSERQSYKFSARLNRCFLVRHESWDMFKVFTTKAAAEAYIFGATKDDDHGELTESEDIIDALTECGAWEMEEGEIV